MTLGLCENYHGALVKWRNHQVHTEQSCFGHIWYQPGGYCGPRVQRDYQLVIVHAGECTVAINSHHRRVATGQVALFRPGQRELFTFSADRETNHSWISVRPESVPDDVREALDRAPDETTPSPLLENLLRCALESGDATTGLGRKIVDQIGIALLTEYLRSCEAVHRVPLDEPVIKALRYMENHAEDPDCLQRACQISACSRTALIKKFHRGIGQTPGRHLWHLRTEKGIRMLRETGLTIAEISDRCGFSNPYHFSRRVRNTTGKSPRAIRDAAWRTKDT